MALWAQFQIVAVCVLLSQSSVGRESSRLSLSLSAGFLFSPLIVGSFLLHGWRFNVYKTKHNFLFHFYDNGWMDVYFSLITSWFYELLLLLLLETERESEWGSLLSTQKKKRGKWHGSFIPLFLSSARLRVSSLSQHDWPPCFSFPNLFKWLYLSSSSLSIVLFSLPLQFNNTKTFCVGRKYIIFTFRVGGYV
jgi:hypothetical protein